MSQIIKNCLCVISLAFLGACFNFISKESKLKTINYISVPVFSVSHKWKSLFPVTILPETKKSAIYLLGWDLGRFLNENGAMMILIKPQFEVGKENLTKLWVPKDEKIVEEKMSNFCLILQKKWVKIPLIKNSVLTWENGNKEIFILIEK